MHSHIGTPAYRGKPISRILLKLVSANCETGNFTVHGIGLLLKEDRGFVCNTLTDIDSIVRDIYMCSHQLQDSGDGSPSLDSLHFGGVPPFWRSARESL